MIEPLEPDGRLNPGRNRSTETFGSLLKRGVLHRESDTKLEAFFDRYTEGFSNLNLSSLYYNEEIGWREIGDRTKQIKYRGEPRDDKFRFTTRGVTEPLRETGASTTQITIQSLEQAFLLSTFRRVNVGPLTEERTMTILRRINAFLDFNRKLPSIDSDTKLLKTYSRRIEADIPTLSRFLDQFVDFQSVGQPGGGSAPSHVRLQYELQGEAFQRHYPEFYRVYDQTLRPSGLGLVVSDSTGRKLLKYSRDGNTVKWEFFTRKGRIVPFVDTTPVNHPGYGPADLRRMELESKTSSYLYMFGLYFGMEGLTFRSDYSNGRVTWRLIEAPDVNLPWGIRLILSPFISPFLNYLETGPNGTGVLYRESFRQRGGTNYRIERLRLPLKDSPFIPFMLKLYNLAWQPLDQKALDDLIQFGRDASRSLQRDYREYTDGDE